MLKSYVAFDIETTGLSAAEHEIIEIGALKVRNGKIDGRFMQFIKPEHPIPPAITALTGICGDMVLDARGQREVLPEFLEFCGEDVLIGHNISFDYSFVKAGADMLGYPFAKEGIDTLKIARHVHSELPSKSLGSLCSYYAIENSAAHRAYHDALATAKLYQTLAHYYEAKSPEVFCPSQLVYRPQKALPASAKQIGFLKRLTTQGKIRQQWDPETLTKTEASRMIEEALSGNGTACR